MRFRSGASLDPSQVSDRRGMSTGGMAAAFAVVPIVIMAIYLSAAKRLGAFDAL